MREIAARLRWHIIAAIGGPTPSDFAALAIKAQAWDHIRPALTRAEQLCCQAGADVASWQAHQGFAASAAHAVHDVCAMVEALIQPPHAFDASGRCPCGEWRQ